MIFRPSVFWYRDGTRLTNDEDPSNRIRIGHIGRKHILSVASISADRDSGMYSCHAINDIGEAKENFQILTGETNLKSRSFILIFYNGSIYRLETELKL